VKIVTEYLREASDAALRGWDRFWFSETAPETYCLIRVFTGAMLLYTHLVWTIDLNGFFGSRGRLSLDFIERFNQSMGDQHGFMWSHLYWLESSSALMFAHVIALVILLLFAIGFASRVTSVLAFLITVSYAHRASGALFGLDQINTFLVLYLMVGPCGECYSIDRWLRSRRLNSDQSMPVRSFVSTNIATRLMQIHLCVVYFFAGAGKLLGETWWAGTALWGAFASYEYQTIDMTWTATAPLLVNFLSQFSLLWELSYCVLVWNRITRPIVIVFSVPLHLGIAFCMGMITFGLIMLVANLAFVSPELVRAAMSRKTPAGQGRAVEPVGK
jgi:uncharacterized membrane protein YphA (DoxX/SURF4 family)